MSDDSAPQRITPYITVHDGDAAMRWYADALGATETVRYVGDDGRLGHAQFVVSGATVMLSDAYPEMDVVAATSQPGSSHALHLEVDHCDQIHDQGVANGAVSLQPPTDQPHGARQCTIMDPFGHRWMLSQTVSTPEAAEIAEAMDGFSVIEST